MNKSILSFWSDKLIDGFFLGGAGEKVVFFDLKQKVKGSSKIANHSKAVFQYFFCKEDNENSFHNPFHLVSYSISSLFSKRKDSLRSTLKVFYYLGYQLFTFKIRSSENRLVISSIANG